jgi:hypothetical protein
MVINIRGGREQLHVYARTIVRSRSGMYTGNVMGISHLWHLALLGLVLVAGPVSAQGSGDGFLFEPPTGTFAIRGGFDRATAGSDVFAFVTNELTVNRGDFSAPTLAFDVGVHLSPRVEALFGVGISHSATRSEFRHWLDNNNQPIQQITTFARVPLTASVKAYLAGPGRSIGRFAWIPARYAPYVGAGGGALWYRLHQDGDFIDFATTRVFTDSFDSSGWTPTLQGFVGTDVTLNPRLALTGELRYQWAKATLGPDFAGFSPIDLTGVSATGGVVIRY